MVSFEVKSALNFFLMLNDMIKYLILSFNAILAYSYIFYNEKATVNITMTFLYFYLDVFYNEYNLNGCFVYNFSNNSSY